MAHHRHVVQRVVEAEWKADHQQIYRELTRLRDDRFRRGEMIVEKLQSLGYDISFERVREIAGGGNIVRPHIAQAMVEAGIVPTEKDAFTEEFIADGGRADVPRRFWQDCYEGANV